MTRPMEPISLDDPAGTNRPQPQREGKVHPTPAKAPAAADPLPGKIHPTPAPLTFAQTFGAVFLAILAAAVVFWFVAAIITARQEQKKLDKEFLVLFGVILSMICGPTLFAASPAEQQLAEAIKAPGLSVVHLWAPWCSNCQAELKSGGWLKTIKENPEVKVYFVSIWNGGDDGRAMLTKFEIAGQPNVTILADPGPRRGADKIKRFLDLPLTWIPTTWVFKGGDLRYALNYGEVRFDVLQQFLADSNSEW